MYKPEYELSAKLIEHVIEQIEAIRQDPERGPRAALAEMSILLERHFPNLKRCFEETAALPQNTMTGWSCGSSLNRKTDIFMIKAYLEFMIEVARSQLNHYQKQT